MLPAILVIVSALYFTPNVSAQNCAAQAQVPQGLLGIALTNLKSFEYVHRALEEAGREIPSAEFCVNAIPLAKNSYQYLEYVIQIGVRARGATRATYLFTFLYQDASVQALHNVGAKPWVAIDRKSAQAFFRRLVATTALRSTGLADVKLDALPIARQSKLFINGEATLDPESLLTMNLNLEDDLQVALVGWLNLPGGNIYANHALPKTVLVVRKESSGEIFTGEGLWTDSDVAEPLHRLLELERQALVGTNTDLTQRLLDISRE